MRKWLQQLVDQYLPVIAELDDTPANRAVAQEQADWMKQQWAVHGMATLAQQRNLMTDVRQAIKHRLGPQHFSLESMDFTSEEWTQMNHAIAERVAEQNQQQVILDPGTVNAIVTRATNLLLSREWAEIAAGLAVLTGRRSTEVLKTATFEPKSAYSVLFTGALKRRGEDMVLQFEIPTLCQAQYVLTAWNRLRKFVPTQELTNEQVNDRLAGAVAKACDRHFSDLVPPVVGRDNLYTHLFRKVYATIATYFYCPNSVDEAEYRAEIQGHFAGHAHLSQAARRTIASDRHYRSYVIQEQDGVMRKGIKLGLKGVEVIEVFQPTGKRDAMSEETQRDTITVDSKRPLTRLRVFRDERDRWGQVLEKIAPEGTQAQKMSALLDWTEWQLAQAEMRDEVAEELVTPEPVVVPESETAIGETAVASTPTLVGEDRTVPPQTDTSPAMEQTWEKLGDLTQVLTRLAERLDASAQMLTPALATGQLQEAGAVPPRMADLVRPQETTLTAQSAAPMVPLKTKTVTAASRNGGEEQHRSSSTSRSVKAEAKVNQAIDQLIQHNSQPGLRREQMWAITLSVLKPLTKVYQKAIQRVLEQRHQEIEAHHQQYGLGVYHNTVHRKSGTAITDVVKL